MRALKNSGTTKELWKGDSLKEHTSGDTAEGGWMLSFREHSSNGEQLEWETPPFYRDFRTKVESVSQFWPEARGVVRVISTQSIVSQNITFSSHQH